MLAILAIVVTMAILIGSCAAISAIATTELIGNIGDQIDITPPSNIGNWNFVSGSNTASGTFHVNANNNWNLNVKSDRPDGRMGWWDPGLGGYSNRADMTPLINPMQVGFNGGDPVSLSGTDRSLAANMNSVNQDYPISFKQEIVTEGDPHDSRLSPPMRYHLVVTFTGFISY